MSVPTTSSASVDGLAGDEFRGVYRELLGQWGNIFFGPRTLLMQVAHPAVGAAVAQHSPFHSDPYGRLTRTLQSLMTYVYGTAEEVATEVDRLQRLHTPLTGTDDAGRRYSGRDPAAVLWVHATFFEPFVTFAPSVVPNLDQQAVADAYEEWKSVGLALGVRPKDLPPTVGDFTVYLESMIEDGLEDNETVQDVFTYTFDQLRPPIVGRLPRLVWAPAWSLPVAGVRLLTVGSLDPRLRARFGRTWSSGEQRRYERLVRVASFAQPRIPAPLAYLPGAAKAMRRVRAAARSEARRTERTSRLRRG